MLDMLRLVGVFVVGFAPVALAGAQGPIVTLNDGVISPQTIEIPTGKAVTLTVSNTGDAAAEFESKRLRIEKIIASGKTMTIKLRPLPTGSYPFVEEFHGNLATAKGTIVVK